jgi:hypothetical protein
VANDIKRAQPRIQHIASLLAVAFSGRTQHVYSSLHISFVIVFTSALRNNAGREVVSNIGTHHASIKHLSKHGPGSVMQ